MGTALRAARYVGVCANRFSVPMGNHKQFEGTRSLYDDVLASPSAKTPAPGRKTAAATVFTSKRCGLVERWRSYQRQVRFETAGS